MKQADKVIREQEDAKFNQTELVREQKQISNINKEQNKQVKYQSLLETIVTDQAN